MADEALRTSTSRGIEQDAELLIVYQLDLLAQLEAQLRAVHHTMRGIEKLRAPQSRVGPELSNGERLTTIQTISREIVGIDSLVASQHDSCRDMQAIIEKMQERIAALRAATVTAHHGNTGSRDEEERDTTGSASGQ